MGEPNVDTALLAEIKNRLDLRQPNAAAVESVANVVSHHFDVQEKGTPFECIVDSATGVGKTYVMAGLIEYFAGRDPAARNFLLQLALVLIVVGGDQPPRRPFRRGRKDAKGFKCVVQVAQRLLLGGLSAASISSFTSSLMASGGMDARTDSATPSQVYT